LIAFKQYDIAVIEYSLLQIVERGVAYLKATIEPLDVSTVVRYAQYYLRRSQEIAKKMRGVLLKLIPEYRYEKDPRIQITHASRVQDLRRGLIMSDTIRQIISVKIQMHETKQFSFVNFVMAN
jgi:hypothetical protein